MKVKVLERHVRRSASLVVRVIREIARDERGSSRILPPAFPPYPSSSPPRPFFILSGSALDGLDRRLVDLHLVISRPTLRRAEFSSSSLSSLSPVDAFPFALPHLPFVISSSFRFIEWNVRSLVPCLPACLPLDTLDSRVNGIILELRSFFLSVFLRLSFSGPLFLFRSPSGRGGDKERRTRMHRMQAFKLRNLRILVSSLISSNFSQQVKSTFLIFESN